MLVLLEAASRLSYTRGTVHDPRAITIFLHSAATLGLIPEAPS